MAASGSKPSPGALHIGALEFLMYSRILVPIDGSAPAESGLREAIRIATATRAKLVVLNVVNEFPLLMDPVALADYNSLLEALARAGEQLVAKAAKAAAEAGIECESVVVDATSGQAATMIVEQAVNHRCDLIVMGTHGRRGLKRLALGSDAEVVVRHAPVPVLLVKAPPSTR
jgi:nucleotide-binding universal stress UspA family protein